MDLNILWFLLIGVLFGGFFFLEGFDYGTGAILPLVARSNEERRLVLGTIGPVWDGNEVWLLTAGGAIFAAFPHWYATMFSGFYLALFLILLMLILRIVAIEYRNKSLSPTWQKRWDMILSGSSAVVALLWGVAVTNLVTGVPIGADMEYAGTFWNLVGPFDLVGGIMFLALFCYHGTLFVQLKTDDKAIRVRCKRYGTVFFIVFALFLVAWLALAFFLSGMFNSLIALAFTGAAAVGLGISIFGHLTNRQKTAFFGCAAGILCFTGAVFSGMFPNVMISTIDPAYSLTIYSASSSAYTLQVMTIVALTMVPIVLVYQIWSYWVFRKRLTRNDLRTLDY